MTKKRNRTIPEVEKALCDLKKKKSELWESEIAPRKSELAPFEAKNASYREDILGLEKEVTEMKVALVNRDKPDWKFLLQSHWREGVPDRNFLDELLRERGLNGSGGSLEATNQAVVQIGMYRDDKGQVDKVIKGLKEILPHLMPSDIGKEYGVDFPVIYVDIIEKTLSRHGIYALFVKPDGKTGAVSMMRYHHGSMETKFMPLKKILNYIQKEVWYEKSSGPDYEDSEDDDNDWIDEDHEW